MNRFLFGMAIILTACAVRQIDSPGVSIQSTSLPDLGPAPELTNETWLNTDIPLRLAELRGRVVAIDMWTFG